MVLMLAAESVEKKLEMQASVLVGNYEFYYAAGKLAAVTEFLGDEQTPPLELKMSVEQAFEKFQPTSEDKKGQYLKKMLIRYRPSESYDEQMKELFLWGKEGKES